MTGATVSVNGKALQRWRLERLLTQRELAELAGVKVETISRIENNHHPSFLATVRKLATALNVDPRELLKDGHDG